MLSPHISSHIPLQISKNLLDILPPGSNHSLFDRKAIVTDVIQPRRIGRVKFQGTWWFARCRQDIALMPNTTVYVVDRENLTLVVEPIDLEEPCIEESSN